MQPHSSGIMGIEADIQAMLGGMPVDYGARYNRVLDHFLEVNNQKIIPKTNIC